MRVRARTLEAADQRKIFERETPTAGMAMDEERIGPAIVLLNPAASFVAGVDLFGGGRVRALASRPAAARLIPLVRVGKLLHVRSVNWRQNSAVAANLREGGKP